MAPVTSMLAFIPALQRQNVLVDVLPSRSNLAHTFLRQHTLTRSVGGLGGRYRGTFGCSRPASRSHTMLAIRNGCMGESICANSYRFPVIDCKSGDRGNSLRVRRCGISWRTARLL